jgi:apolipoprotein N-acyltransferase
MTELTTRSRFAPFVPCILSGLLFGLSGPSYPYVRTEFLAWVWMVPLLFSLKHVHSFPRFLGRVFLTTSIMCLFGMHWLAAATIKGTLFLILLGSAVFTVPFIAFFFVRRVLGMRTALWSAPFIWTSWDWLYQQSEGSFGWLAMGVTQANLYWLVQYVDITGLWGITFWLVLFNVLFFMGLDDWLANRAGKTGGEIRFLARRLVFTCGLTLIVPLVYSAYVFSQAVSSAEGRNISVLLVQPNVNPWEKLAAGSQQAVLRKTIALTNSALTRSGTTPDLIIWPETAVPMVLSDDKDARELVYRAVTRWQTPLLTGLLDAQVEPDKPVAQRSLFNGAVVLSPGIEQSGRRLNIDSSSIYHKRVLMPFVERVPFVDKFPSLQRLAVQIGAGDGVQLGREATTFSFRTRSGQEIKVASAICYEALYPAKVAELVRNGAQFLSLITNEGWFSQTHGEYQIAAFSRLRSIETRRAAARAANTGVTWIVDQYGRVHEQSPWWSEQTLAGRVTLSDELSLYVRYPDYFPRACVWLSLALMCAVVTVKLRRSHSQSARDDRSKSLPERTPLPKSEEPQHA